MLSMLYLIQMLRPDHPGPEALDDGGGAQDTFRGVWGRCHV